MPDLLKQLFFYYVLKKNWPKTVTSPSVRVRHRNRPGVRSNICREGALDGRESRERHKKIVSINFNFSPAEKQEKRNFGLKSSTFLSGIACCSRESTSAKSPVQRCAGPYRC